MSVATHLWGMEMWVYGLSWTIKTELSQVLFHLVDDLTHFIFDFF